MPVPKTPPDSLCNQKQAWRPSLNSLLPGRPLQGPLSIPKPAPKDARRPSTNSLASATCNFTVRVEFDKDQGFGAKSGRLVGHGGEEVDMTDVFQRTNSMVLEDSNNSNISKMIPVKPDSAVATVWDVAASIFIMHDFVVMPLSSFQTAYEMVESPLRHLASIFWVLNVFVRFFIGYMDKYGHPVTSFSKVARRYVWTWLGFDVFLVVVDFLPFVLGGHSGKGVISVRTLLALRLIRLLRIARLVEVLKVARNWLAVHVRSAGLNVVLEIIKSMAVLMSFAHLFACGWYAVGTLRASNWVKSEGMEGETFWYRYCTSFSWAWIQFSGDVAIAPQNEAEQTYATVVQCVAFVFSVLVISNLTTVMTQVQMHDSQRKKQLQVLQCYLLDSNVSAVLATRVLDNAVFLLEEKKRNPPEHTVELLQEISTPLLKELRYSRHQPALTSHPFFMLYDTRNPFGMRNVCHSAMRDGMVSSGDIIFSPDEESLEPCLYFVTKGSLAYAADMWNGERLTHIKPGTCVNEAALWLSKWRQIGTLYGHEPCQMLVLDVTQAVAMMSQHRTKTFYPSVYARFFTEALNSAYVEEVTDIASDFMDVGALAENAFGKQGPETKSRRRRMSLRFRDTEESSP
eukprot:TRINITY_DN33988_c0_g1_i1.p1 TRINITY_DN33988_c0_g1~~TRINITY_DN33988_c0_g1_i1.p1  ORF type:complete len:714 (+),score=91.84 TRINITY_DN33988_c0_g1_i1:264-2144(+)